MNIHNHSYQLVFINSAYLEIPRTTYQRELDINREHKIASEFDERIANEPKVNFRNGHYYVFDGQHTIAAQKLRNEGKDLPILCKVYYSLTESDEAFLFAQQTGTSTSLNASAKLRALVYSGDKDAVEFLRLTESIGPCVGYKQTKEAGRLTCISTAFRLYKKFGSQMYRKAMHIIVDAWNGNPDSLRADMVSGVMEFVNLYNGEYNRSRLVARLRQADPLVIVRESQTMTTLAKSKRYLYQIYRIYNGFNGRNTLPMKF